MQLIPKTNNRLHVCLDTPFEVFLYEQSDYLAEFVRLHLGCPEAIFERHIPLNNAVILVFDLRYNYLEDLAKIKRNVSLSNYSKKMIIGSFASSEA